MCAGEAEPRKGIKTSAGQLSLDPLSSIPRNVEVASFSGRPDLCSTRGQALKLATAEEIQSPGTLTVVHGNRDE